MKVVTSFTLGSLLCGLALTSNAATATIVGWNNLGMHCMDSDYSVFSILPPYNTIEGQLIVGGRLVTNGAGYTVTYQAVADPAGSINKTSFGKSTFYTYVQDLYPPFVPVATDVGIAGWNMPGPANVPQTNLFQTLNEPVKTIFTPVNWFHAEGIPLTPYDDAGQKNPYPLMRMIARDSNYLPIATNDIVLPVSDEMDCRACHASGTHAAAQPAAGWVWDGLPERDYRLNILRLHDERQFAQHAVVYAGALAANHYNPAGLYRRVTAEGKPVLCALCHASEALQTAGYPSLPPLTTSVHSQHANVMDPITNTNLDSAVNRSACYRCHPGSTTRCLRGAMGSAIAADGSMEMQCQSCHGNMSAVGSSSRVGWIMEPNCQACHTGTATSNAGQIRFTSALLADGSLRTNVNRTFATTLNTPPTPFNLSLYRFSVGHGGLQCSACHGSTHAEFPSSHHNDNVRNIALQGHAGVLADCTACHTSMPTNAASGPHGMHPVGSTWASEGAHGRAAKAPGAQCQACHGTDYHGTVLSRMLATRTVNGQTLFQGAIVSCFNCHGGPRGDDDGPAPAAPTAANVAANTTNDKSVSFLLPMAGTNLIPRIITQSTNGAVGVNTNTLVATYYPNPGFVGTDSFTFAAYNTSRNSTLATGTVTVTQGPFSLGVVAHVPPTYPAGWPVAFAAVPSVTNNAGAATFNWNFGDGSAHSTDQYAAHTYASPGTYNWSVTASVSTASAIASGSVVIGGSVQLSFARSPGHVTLSWPNTIADTLLEGTPALGSSAQWVWVTNTPAVGPSIISLTLPTTGNEFLRVRRPW